MNEAQIRREIARMLLHVEPLGAEKLLIPPAVERDFKKFENDYGLAIPSELRAWLLMHNGAAVKPGGLFGLSSSGLRTSIESLLDLEPRWRQLGWLPIAGDGCGDYYVLASRSLDRSTHSRPVFFLDQTDYCRADYAVASDIWHFLWFYLDTQMLLQSGRSPYWPFNAEEVLLRDSALADCVDVPLPWQQ